MNNLGILNNRFHQKAIQNRMKTQSNQFYMINTQIKKQKNEYYQKWLRQREKDFNSSTDTCLDIITPNLPKPKIPNTFQVKFINDILNNNNKNSFHY
ncbi:unnamed protein product [Paramecium sonneborni]|uniref:Uncharacterized protein n=1 Tax=Paramecium sonneborni TaxID=65129 RepID=A0A8S1R965_9CILI|nr:unnamed protein product [Paramecium sonneborni]